MKKSKRIITTYDSGLGIGQLIKARKYLVFAEKRKNELVAVARGGTNFLSDAKADLEKLGKGSTPNLPAQLMPSVTR